MRQATGGLGPPAGRIGWARVSVCVLALALPLAGAAQATRSGAHGLIQQGEKLTGGGEVGMGRFGSSVALPAEGNIALVGGPDDDGLKGAVWVFTRTGTAWSQQGIKLTGIGETGNG